MSYDITGDDVRNRLRTLGTVDGVTDTLLASYAYIPACNGFVNTVLAYKGYAISTLGNDKKNMAKGAIAALVAARVVSSAPLHSFRASGLVDHKDTPAQEKAALVKLLKDEAWDLLGWIGVPRHRVYFGDMTSDDYMPDGGDETNLLMNDEEETTFSMWP